MGLFSHALRICSVQELQIHNFNHSHCKLTQRQKRNLRGVIPTAGKLNQSPTLIDRNLKPKKIKKTPKNGCFIQHCLRATSAPPSIKWILSIDTVYHCWFFTPLP